MFARLKDMLVGTPVPRRSGGNPVYRKKEYYDAPEKSATKTQEAMWASLPKVNPRVLLGGHGASTLVDNELSSTTNSSWDPRGEHEAVKRIQSVVIPSMLQNDRMLTAAQQRSANRDLQGIKPNQV